MSLYVEINQIHRHNGRTHRAGTKLRLPNATALAMIRTGRASRIQGAELVKEKLKRGDDPETRKIKREIEAEEKKAAKAKKSAKKK